MATHSYSQIPSYGYIPALDGLRAVSILLVMLSHFGWSVFPGGFGVTVFFFISGFLISRQLLCGLRETGRIDFGGFYMRRILRLLPALAVMILLSLVLYMAFGGRPGIGEVLSALFYGANYYDIYIRYDSTVPGVRHPFLILWSLAIEEHFYIFFPWFLAFFHSRGRRIVWILAFLLVAALLWRLALWHACDATAWKDVALCGRRGPSRLYAGTDTRFDSLLYGVMLTVLLAREDFPRLTNALKGKFVFCTSLALLAVTFALRGEAFRETFRYSLQGVALCGLVAAILFADWLAGLRAVLASRPLVLTGRWSYSLYLYHWVGLMVAEALVRFHYVHSLLPSALLLTLVLAPASYYLIEFPMVGWRRRFGSHTVADMREART